MVLLSQSTSLHVQCFFLSCTFINKFFDHQNTSYNESFIYTRKTRIKLSYCSPRLQSREIADDIGIYLHNQFCHYESEEDGSQLTAWFHPVYSCRMDTKQLSYSDLTHVVR